MLNTQQFAQLAKLSFLNQEISRFEVTERTYNDLLNAVPPLMQQPDLYVNSEAVFHDEGKYPCYYTLWRSGDNQYYGRICRTPTHKLIHDGRIIFLGNADECYIVYQQLNQSPLNRFVIYTIDQPPSSYQQVAKAIEKAGSFCGAHLDFARHAKQSIISFMHGKTYIDILPDNKDHERMISAPHYHIREDNGQLRPAYIYSICNSSQDGVYVTGWWWEGDEPDELQSDTCSLSDLDVNCLCELSDLLQKGGQNNV